MRIPRDSRAAAACVLANVSKQQGSLASLLPAAQAQVPAKDHAFLQALCYGVCRQWQTLENHLNQLLEKPLRNKDADIKALLLLGLYQLFYLRTPDHAAVSATVQASRALKKPWARGLLNSVLRNALKQAGQQGAPEALTPAAEHPEWLRQAIQTAWPESADAIFAANLTPAPMTLRVNAKQGSRTQYRQQLTSAGIAAAPIESAVVPMPLPMALSLVTPVDVAQLPGFADGSVSVQDAHAQLAATLLSIESDMRVLDSCAAPGGKTAHIAETYDCHITALDVDSKRVERMQTGFERLQLTIDCKTADATELETWWDGKPFERILLDAPCSATGVIRRHPDIKLTRRAEDIPALAARQLQLLEALWSTLAEGGRLLYATCSILPMENAAVIRQFVQQQSDAQVVNFSAVMQQFERQIANESVGWQLFPGQAGTHGWNGDGFYYAMLEKTR